MPARGVDLVTGDYRVVYVRTDAGTIYGCRHKGTRADRKCWYETHEPLDVSRYATFDKRYYQREVEPPAGTVVDPLGVKVWHAEDTFETRYVLLEDGSVFKWEYDVGAYWTIAILLFGIAIGGAVAVVGVIVLWIRARRQRSPPLSV